MTQTDTHDSPSRLEQLRRIASTATERSADDAPPVVERLRRIARAMLRRPAGAPPDVWPELARDLAAADPVATAIGALLHDVDSAWLAAHDEAFRSPWQPCHGWLPGAATGDRLRQLRVVGARGPQWPTPTLCILAACPVGHVRERAVELLATRPEPIAFGALLIRTNDWVDVVRGRAAQALRERLAGDAPRVLIENLGLAQRLRASRRADHTALVDAIEARIVAAFDAEVVIGALRTGSRDLRRRLAALAARSRSQGACALAVLDSDDVVSTTAALGLLDHPDAATACDWSRRLADHRAPMVRTGALRTAATRCVDGLRERLVGALEDPVPQVRWAAAYHAERRFGIDVRAHYLHLLQVRCGRATGIVPLALREFGRAEDAPQLAPLLDDADPRVRMAAMLALATLDVTAIEDRLLPALASRQPSESRVAARLIDRLGPHRHAASLRDLLLSTALPHVRIQVLRAASRLSKWPRLDLLLRAVALGDPALTACATDHLRDWLQRVNRSFVAPTDAERAALAAALAVAASDLRDDVSAGLRRVIDAA